MRRSIVGLGLAWVWMCGCWREKSSWNLEPGTSLQPGTWADSRVAGQGWRRLVGRIFRARAHTGVGGDIALGRWDMWGHSCQPSS